MFFHLIHLLFAEASYDMSSMEGWMLRSHLQRGETGRKGLDRPNYTRTGPKTNVKSYEVMKPNLMILIQIVTSINGDQERCIIVSVYIIL